MQETDPLFRTTSNNNSNSYPFYAPVTTTTTTTMNGYDNDETVEERDEESAADEDFGLVDHRPRRRRYLEGGNGDGQPWFMLYLTWMMIGTMLVIGVLGLFAWKRHESSPLHPSSASIGEFDTYNTSPTSSSSSSSQQLDGDSSSSSSWFHKKDPEPAAATRTTFSASLFGKETLETLMKDAGVVKPHHVKTVHYDPSGVLQAVNPFDFQMPDTYTSSVLLPGNVFHKDDDDTESGKLGYFQHPSIVNNQLIFCAEGDVFVTHLNKNTEEQHHMPATKLTTTVGNVLDPKWHPSLQYLAYTATYSGSRDLYLMDLKKGGHSMRLTYWDLDSGVTGLVGWWGNSLVFRAVSNDASLRDSRLYVLHLDNISPEDVDRNLKKKHQSSGPVSVLSIDPIPLSQAIDAARYDDCWYFVRYSQSSHTIRYVGGTTEQLWKYCDSEKSSERLIDDGYRGTSKSPQVYQSSAGRNYLFFLSDRKMIGSKNDKEWQPDRMNIWAYDLKMEDEDGAQFAAKYLIQITDTACDFEGRLIQEYTIDAVTGNVVARIGADLYLLGAETIETKLKKRRRRQLADDDGSEDSPGPSPAPSEFPSERPSSFPSEEPTTTEFPSELPNEEPSEFPSEEPSNFPSNFPLKSGEAEEGEVKEKPNENAGEKEGKDKKDTPSQEAEEKEKEGEEASSVYYNYLPAETKALAEEPYKDHHSGTSTELTRLRIMVHSDFYTHHERLLPVNVLEHLSTADVYETTVGTTHFLMTLRGQLWVAPVVDDELPTYEGAGRNMPERRYRVAPGAMMGGLVRILTALHVPNPVEDDETDRRLAVVLATDPLSETAEHAFYLIETQSDTTPSFLDVEHLPIPFLGGHVSGGSAKDGGLGSVKIDSLTLSPCGRRMAWTDTDGRIAVMNLPQYQDMSNRDSANFVLLPNKNEMGEPMMGDEVDLVFSPGGRYLAVNHHASNQFDIISIVDLGDAQGENKVADINVGRIVQATPSRFNSESMYWGKTTMDISVYARDAAMAEVFGTNEPADVATTLYFLSDRDIKTDVTSPWGTRQPLPHFAKSKAVYALPLMGYDDMPKGRFAGGGASELLTDKVLERKKLLQSLLDLMNSGGDGSGSSGSDGGSDDNKRRLAEKQKFVKSFHPLTGAFGIAEKSFGRTEVEQQQQRTLTKEDQAETDATMRKADFPKDLDIDFGPVDLTFGRRAYRVANIPEANYYEILCQTPDNGSLVLVEASDGDMVLTVYLADDFPSDKLEAKPFTPVIRTLAGWGLSTNRNYFYLGFLPDGKYRVVENSLTGIAGLLTDPALDENVVDSDGLHLSIWPSLEYRQMYSDAWRMLRDYYYDPEMTGIDWPAIHERYLPLVARCTKREELDDVLAQMASELSALHVFVYGGEYNSPLTSRDLKVANQKASLGAILKRTPDWKGYTVMSIPERDPDFSMIDGNTPIYSPLSNQALQLSGQKGLEVGDVIVGVNGESVMRVPDIHMLLRGMAGRSVRLDVLRLASGGNETSDGEVPAEAVITVPLDPFDADDLLYNAWEWKTKQLAETLAEEAGFSVGYVHLQSMSGPEAEDAFARGFFPSYNKEAFILDVRHNRGGSIDSWVLDVLQRQVIYYWQSRDLTPNNGGLAWDEHFAFRGHIVVLIDEKTSSDGEGVSRGIAELGIGKLIGTRTWGGGIWLSSDNHLVDGGIATAPEVGTFNDNWGWGMGIENMGVEPDIEVDNDPHESFKGIDKQLEFAIEELKRWIKEEPVVKPQPPEKKKDMTMGNRECPAK